MTVERGRRWGDQAPGAADRNVTGSDADLASRVRVPTVGTDPTTELWHYQPSHDADFARAVGLDANRHDRAAAGGIEIQLDALVVTLADRDAEPFVAVNAVEIGAVADRIRRRTRRHRYSVAIDAQPKCSGRATGLLVANGQFLRGVDAVPRGHPGDGIAEVQVYAMGPGGRGPMGRRLATGSHVPHPEILERRGRRIEVKVARPLMVTADNSVIGTCCHLIVSVLPGALRLLL